MAKKAKPGNLPREKRERRHESSWRWLAAPAAIVLGGAAVLIYLAVDRDAVQSRANRDAVQWAVDYWQRPIAPQGEPPRGFADQAKGLQPEDCGVCHVDQYAGWKDSLHALTMGPGVTGQFPTLHPQELTQCHECHAPLSEQYRLLPGADGLAENPLHDPALEAKGLVCAACHLREHRRHGPPLREGRASLSQAVHGEPFRTPFFEASEFCRGCHQHPETAMKVNGKTVENTYNEWLASPYAAQGITCQSCHMPDRQHLWKGIHDPEMTRQGVTITAEADPERLRSGERIRARLTITNSGTGHAFPTYTTPAVFLRAALLDTDDRPLRGHYEERILQRRLDMSTVPWGEEFDTRLLPGQSATLEFERIVPPGAATLYLWIWVDPDHFYHGFFRSRLEENREFAGREQLQAALEETVRRRYLLWSRKIPIERGP
jgi:hypothetical protein